MRAPVIHSKRRPGWLRNVLLYLLVGCTFASLAFFLFGRSAGSNEIDPLGNEFQHPIMPPRYVARPPQEADDDEDEEDIAEDEDQLDKMQFATDDIGFDDHGRTTFPRIFCMVPTQPHAREKFTKILDTWGKWCDGVSFMIDPPVYSLAGEEHLQPEETIEVVTSTDGRYTANIVQLNKLVRKKGNNCYTGGHEFNPKTGKEEPVYTTCRHIWEKVWRSWVYISDHHAEQYDFFFKVDDDTFFFVPTMREVLLEKEWKPTEHHYFGQRVFPIGPERGLIAGALVGFSRLTLKTIVEDAYKKMQHEYGDRKKFKHGRCVDRDGATEEVTTSLCANSIGVKPEALYDETVIPRRPHVLLWMPRDMLTYVRRDNSSSWFYKHAPRDVGTEKDCCSDRPVSFHFMRLDSDLQRVYDLIVDDKNERELETLQDTKVPVWEEQSSNPNARRTSCVFDHMPFPPSTCVLEANYLLRVKQKWHARDPKHYLPRLT